MAAQDLSPAPSRFARALIVEDHPLFSDALAITLGTVSGIADVQTAGSLAEALDVLGGATPPDIVLLDLNLPDVDGLDGLLQIGRAANGAPVLIVSSMSDDRTIAAALSAGASGFVPKHSQRGTFQEAFETLAEGRPYLPEGFIQSRGETDDTGPSDISRLRSLTAQQARILALICDGKLNKQIAYDLSIAETTVKAHVTAIMRKLGVQSRTQAVLIAQRAKFDHVAEQE